MLKWSREMKWFLVSSSRGRAFRVAACSPAGDSRVFLLAEGTAWPDERSRKSSRSFLQNMSIQSFAKMAGVGLVISLG